jgi:hypothetical protein
MIVQLAVGKHQSNRIIQLAENCKLVADEHLFDRAEVHRVLHDGRVVVPHFQVDGEPKRSITLFPKGDAQKVVRIVALHQQAEHLVCLVVRGAVEGIHTCASSQMQKNAN